MRREMSDDERQRHPAYRFGQDWELPGAMTVIKAPKPEPIEDLGGDDGELSNVPLLEDNWEVNPETSETEWVPFMLASPPMPGYPGPVRYGWWPGKYRYGKRVKSEDVEADIEDARRQGLIDEGK